MKVRIPGLMAYLLRLTPNLNSRTHLLYTEKNSSRGLGKLDVNKLSPQTILMYCNFTNPIVIGNTYGQVLQMIPFGDTAGKDQLKYEAQHLDFIPLSMNDKTVLQFEMRDARGSLIEFKDNKTEILLTLVFRERK